MFVDFTLTREDSMTVQEYHQFLLQQIAAFKNGENYFIPETLSELESESEVESEVECEFNAVEDESQYTIKIYIPGALSDTMSDHCLVLINIIQSHLHELMPLCTHLILGIGKGHFNRQDLNSSTFQSLKNHVFQGFQYAKNLKSLNVLIKFDDVLIDNSLFFDFTQAFSRVPALENLEFLNMATHNLIVGGGDEVSWSRHRYRITEFDRSFFNALIRCHQLKHVGMSGNYVSIYFEDQLFLCLKNLPQLNSVFYKNKATNPIFHGLAEILRNPSINSIDFEIGGSWSQEGLDGDGYEFYSRSYVPEPEFWNAFDSALRQNNTLKVLKLNMTEIDDPDLEYTGINSSNPNRYFAARFLKVLTTMSRMFSLRELTICFPSFIGESHFYRDNCVYITKCFRNTTHIENIQLRCYDTFLDDGLVAFTELLRVKYLAYQQNIQSNLMSNNVLRKEDLNADDLIYYMRLMMPEVLRLDLEVSKYLTPLIIKMSSVESNQAAIISKGDMNFMNHFAEDLVAHTVTKYPGQSYFDATLSLKILGYLDVKDMASLVFSGGGLIAHLKRQKFEESLALQENQYRRPQVQSGFCLDNGDVDYSYEYCAKDVNEILKLRLKNVKDLQILPTLSTHHPMLGRCVGSTLQQHSELGRYLVWPLQLPGHWVGLVLLRTSMNQTHIYYFDGQRLDERAQKILLGFKAKIEAQWGGEVFVHRQYNIQHHDASHAAVVLIENIASFFEDQACDFTRKSENFRKKHLNLLQQFHPDYLTSEKNAVMETFEQSYVEESMWQRFDKLRYQQEARTFLENGQINLQYHYRSEDINNLLIKKLDRVSNVLVLPAVDFDESNFAYFINNYLLKYSYNRQRLLIPINTGEHWVGLRIDRTEKNEVLVHFFDSLPSEHRAKQILAKIFSCLKITWQVSQVFLSNRMNVLIQRNAYDCGPCLIENMVESFAPELAFINADEARIRMHHREVLSSQQSLRVKRPTETELDEMVYRKKGA